MKIVAGGILRDRWTVGAYLQAMAALDTGGHEVTWAWVLDDTPADLVRAYVSDAVTLEVRNLPGPIYNRQGGMPQERNRLHARLACLRNLLREVALQAGADALFSVDSDILPPPETLVRLVDCGRPWVAALVRNSATSEAWNVYHLLHPEQGGLINHFLPTGTNPKGETWPGPEGCGHDPRNAAKTPDLCAGAVCLYHREVLEKARWKATAHGAGEDTGFGLEAFAASYYAWYLPIVCRHLTIDGVGDA